MNLLFLMVDQWPRNSFGRYDDSFETPNIDKLASESVEYRNAFTTCPLCSPARGTIMTGRWPNQTGLLDNPAAYSRQTPLSLDEYTWLEAGKDNGFEMGYYGKWHLGNEGWDPVRRNEAPEWKFQDRHYSYKNMDIKYRDHAKFLKRGFPPFYGEVDAQPEDMPCFKNALDGVAFLEKYANGDKDKPFCLTVSTASPHFPHYLPKKYAERAEKMASEMKLPESFYDDFKGKPAFHKMPWWPSMDTSGISEREWLKIISYTHQHISMTDDAMGLVLNALDANGLKDDTIVIFVADHGDMPGTHNRFDKGAYFYDEVWRVPLLIREPGKEKGFDYRFVNHLDLSETIFRILDPDDKMNKASRRMGRDLRKADASAFPNETFGFYERYNGMSFVVRAIRNERYKYVFNPQDIDEFYDMDKDPFEMNNLIASAEYYEIVSKLRSRLLEWLESIDDYTAKRDAEYYPYGWIVDEGRMGP